ncbi:MAG: dioxygenase [Clostridiaceae bacterium BRH_c20a]|nr:MAG: dioxygenase [Clostridiaceae bacterium BRH_c20a]
MKKLFGILALILVITVLVAGCGGSNSAKKEEQKLKVGVTAGPHEAIVEKVKELAAKEDLIIEVVTFNDYVQPNIQLADGNIDLNSFQHEPYLDKFKADRKLKLSNIADSVIFPMGIYSQKVKDVSELKAKDKVGLPNDPTNGARALQLFEAAGLIKLKEGVGSSATVKDIVENPKNLEFVELEAPMILRTLPDLAAAAINTNFIVQAGMSPAKESIFIEPKDSPWVNIIVVRGGEEDNPLFKKFVELYQSQEIKDFINKDFQDSVVAAW